MFNSQTQHLIQDDEGARRLYLEFCHWELARWIIRIDKLQTSQELRCRPTLVLLCACVQAQGIIGAVLAACSTKEQSTQPGSMRRVFVRMAQVSKDLRSTLYGVDNSFQGKVSDVIHRIIKGLEWDNLATNAAGCPEEADLLGK